MRSRWPIILATGCAVLTVALGLAVTGEPSGVDTAVITGWPHGVLRALVLPTEPYVLIPVLALLVVWRRRQPWDAVFVAVAPALAVAVNTWVLKPLFGRWKGDTLVYPSGHTVSMVATVVVVCVLTGGLVRAVTAAVGTVLLVAVAIGMIGLRYHYLTDVVGAAFFAVFAVLAVRGLMARMRPVSG